MRTVARRHQNIECELCCSKFDWNDYESENDEPLEDLGTQFRCPKCHARCQDRINRRKRRITVGRLYPGIVCSDDQHPQGVEVERIIANDQRQVKMLIILGTSLEFHGPRTLARRFAMKVHHRGGKVVFVNKTKPRPDIAQFVRRFLTSLRFGSVQNHLVVAVKFSM